MSINFNADEIFEMAEEIERNGAKFYKEAAQNAKDEKTRKTFLDMAAMEQGHLKTFEKMRQELQPEEKVGTTFDPDDEGVQYLQAMADRRGIEGKKSSTERLTGGESNKELYEIALNAEKDSVVFYFGFRSMVSEKAGKDKVEAIIKEELEHIRILQKYLDAVS